jgi:hypothetical protein
MSKPLVVTIPHRLGKQEAARRLQTGLGEVASRLGHLFRMEEENWIGDRLQFRISVLAQPASGSVDVADDHVRLEVFLPWLLATLAEAAQPLIQREGTMLLEKK